MGHITIAIASVGRETLAETLISLSKIACLPGKNLTVLVADDSKDQAAARLIARLRLEDLDIKCIPVASGNISIARNALLDQTEGEWIVFVDDDEWVERDWLIRLFECQNDYNADVVIGPVYPVYPNDAPGWLVRANPLYADWGHRGKRLTTGRGGNTLARMWFIRQHALRFDPALGRSGGEDTAFFANAAARGAVIVATDDAIAREHVPPERLEPDYILRRGIRSGQSYANSRKLKNPGLLWQFQFGGDAVAKCTIAAILALALRPVDRARSFRMKQKLALNLGKLRALFNLPLAQLYAANNQTK
ncbi:glycosyltransferase family 2 protein [Roseibium polysiphoniae]|uniref:Glycosyltransferase family 2 protein n=1 Tax=Roseibium polysiphoniae TaxID=2571221 RepID=A0ABR9CH37_9HYPH|nr:glycosyltransferase family 2 protein [Roseibium polysiphoniae]MBD8878421.1 glycosyltransferase family 2 protein [Roseibium polysiphoniae]